MEGTTGKLLVLNGSKTPPPEGLGEAFYLNALIPVTSIPVMSK
jgi:hypothetical protein